MIEVKSLTKIYPGSTAKAVDDITFAVETGSVFTLLGPSGCGKTTTLRCIAGLEQPDSGTIRLFDETVFSASPKTFVPPSRRRIGMVFQSYAIWPHMTVFQNVAYPLKGSGLARDEIRRRAQAALEMVNLDGLENRPAPRLSGGQQQRVALARAIAADPRIFLFDEPLSNLDAKLRHEMRSQIRALQRKLAVTSLYVTHDQVEALAISDVIAVMDGGHIVEVGSPRDVYLNPKSRFAARFIGHTNMIGGRMLGRERNGASVIELPFAKLSCHHGAAAALPDGAQAIALLRPEHIQVIVDGASPAENSWSGEIVSLEFLGETTDLVVACADQRLNVRTSAFTNFDPGMQVTLSIAPGHFSLIEP